MIFEDSLLKMDKDTQFSSVQVGKQVRQRAGVLEWGIPESTHTNSEVYGRCKQGQASVENIKKTVFGWREKELRKPKLSLS